MEVPEVPEVMRRALLCVLEAVEGELCLLEMLEVPEVMHCVLLCLPDTSEVPEVMRCLPLCFVELVKMEVMYYSACWRYRKRCAVCYSGCWRCWRWRR